MGSAQTAEYEAREVSTRVVKTIGDQAFRTPPPLVKQLEAVLGRRFVLDAAASKVNAVCRRFYDEAKDGRAQPWVDGTFCNPGFKRFGLWIAKGLAEARERSIEVCLVGPVGCSQRWYHEVARQGTVLVPDERISFYDSATGQPTRGADRDSAVYLFGPRWWNRSKEGFRVLPLAIHGIIRRASKADVA